MSLGDDPSVPSGRVSWVHVQLCDVLLHFQIGHQVLDVGSYCVWASVFSLRKSCFLCGLARISVSSHDDLTVVSSLSGWSDPSALFFRVVVSLNPQIYVRSVGSSNVAQMRFEDVSVENVCFKGKFEFVASGADESDRFAL